MDLILTDDGGYVNISKLILVKTLDYLNIKGRDMFLLELALNKALC